MSCEGSRLDELLLEWEERHEAGAPVSPEELCAGDARLLDELRRRVDLLRRFAEIQEPPPQAATPPLPGQIGGYTIRRLLGAGASGVVYLAKDRALGRKVAVKVLSPRLGFLTADERRRLARRFEREAQALARLGHAAIVPVYEARLGEREPFFVMEYLPGGSLRDRAAGPGDPAAVAALMARVADAVRHAHARGIVHRDLKPGNILLDREGRPRVSDFGLAKLIDDALLDRDESSLSFDRPTWGDDPTLTHPGRQPGTPAYMAPEQFDPRHGPIGPPADVWALGAVLYELLTGRHPFAGDGRADLQLRICAEPVAVPATVLREADTALSRLALRCLDKDPARRPTAAELADALSRYRPPGPLRRLAARLWAWRR